MFRHVRASCSGFGARRAKEHTKRRSKARSEEIPLAFQTPFFLNVFSRGKKGLSFGGDEGGIPWMDGDGKKCVLKCETVRLA